MEPFDRVALPQGIRVLYPSWALAGRPRLPRPLDAAEVVHSPSPAAVPPAAPRRRLVVTVHDLAFLVHPEAFPWQWRLMYQAALRRAARAADAILTPSRSTADDLERLARADPARIRVTPLAATLPETSADVDEVLTRLGVPRPYVLFVGTLEPRKNLPRLVRAYGRLAGELPHALVLAGPMGWHGAELEDEVGRTPPGRVVTTGGLGPGDLDALYRGANVFAYPSLYEGFGLPLVEAMARGLPIVTSRVSSMPEVAGDAALLVDPRSEREIHEALARVLTDAELAARLAAASAERARSFSWRTTADLTLEAYRP